MGKSLILIGHGDQPAAGPSTPEAAASEYFINSRIFGDYTPKPPVKRWREDQRDRFETEMRRLEAERVRQVSEAVRAVSERST